MKVALLFGLLSAANPQGLHGMLNIAPTGGGSGSGAYDLEGEALTLDDDGDSTLTCGTDDVCDFQLGGSTTLQLSLSGSDMVLASDAGELVLSGSSGLHLAETGGSNVASFADVSGGGSILYLDNAEFGNNGIGFYANQTFDQGLFWAGNNVGNQFVFGPGGFLGRDYNHAQETDPALYIQSSTDPNSDDTKYGKLQFVAADNTFVISTGSGGTSLAGTAFVRLPIQEAASTSAPVTCDASATGSMEYVDDTNDSGAGVVCVCIATGDDGAGAPNAFDWVRMDNHATACPFY